MIGKDIKVPDELRTEDAKRGDGQSAQMRTVEEKVEEQVSGRGLVRFNYVDSQ